MNIVNKINIVLKRKIRQGIFDMLKIDIDNFRLGVIKDENYYLNYFGYDFIGEDIRGFWEKNRLQDLLPKAIEFDRNRNEDLVIEILDEIKEWDVKNKYLYGKNWICAMEAGIRLANLSLLSYYLKESKTFRNNELFIRTIIVNHFKFVKNNLEVTLRNSLNNHYLSDLAGLIYAFCLFPEYFKSNSYKRFLVEELDEQICQQVLGDGVSIENSTGYHKYVLELFLYTGLVCLKYGIEMTKEYWDRIGKMLAFVESYTKPDRNAPSLGDSDDGYWHKFSNNMISNSHYHLIEIKKLFEDKDYVMECGELNIFINDFYPDKLNRKDLIKEHNNIYKEGGINIYKDDNLYLIITSRNSDNNYKQLHKHNDIFSFELFYKGVPFVVDPGTSTYTKDVQEYNIFRSTEFHNTLKINNIEQQDLNECGLFTLPREGVVITKNTENRKGRFVFQGEYTNNKFGKHIRNLDYTRAENLLKLKDEIIGGKELLLEWYFHIHNEVGIRIEKNIVFLEKNNVKISLKCPVHLNIEIRDGLISESFNNKAESKVLYFNGKYEEDHCVEEFDFNFNILN